MKEQLIVKYGSSHEKEFSTFNVIELERLPSVIGVLLIINVSHGIS